MRRPTVSPPVLWPAMVLVSSIGMGYGAIFTLLPDFRDRYGIDETGLGLLSGGGFAAGFVTLVTLSRFADRGFAVPMIRMGLGLCVASMIGMAAGHTFVVLFVSRIVLGFGSGLATPAIRRLVVNADPDRVGANLGRLSAFDIAGFLLGPVVAVALVGPFGLAAPFVVFAIVITLLSPLVLRLPEGGMIDEERRGIASLVRIPQLQAALLVAVAQFVAIGMFDALWGVLLKDRGAPRWAIGLGLTVLGVPMVILAPLTGNWAQRHGALRLGALGMLVAAPCVVLYGFVEPVWLMLLIGGVHAMGDAFTLPALQVASSMGAPREQQAAAQGLLSAGNLLLAGLSAVIGGAAYDRWGPARVFTVTGILMCVTTLAGLRRAATTASPELHDDAFAPNAA